MLPRKENGHSQKRFILSKDTSFGVDNLSAQEAVQVSERLGPVPADLQAWAKRASVVTTVSRKREARWDLFLPPQNKTETNFLQEKVSQQITDCQKEKCESWEGYKGDGEER